VSRARPPFVALAATAVVLVCVAAAQSAVHRVSITSPVTAGNVAKLTVDVAPAARCTIAVAPRTSVSGANLGPRKGGKITWRWRIRATASPGRSPVAVRCGTSGNLRTSFLIAEPELPLAVAVTAVCAHAPARALAKYKTQLVPLLDRTITTLHEQYGAFSCAYGSNYYKNGGPLSYYLVLVARGNSPCTFSVKTRVVWVSDPPLPGYTGPVDESYVETCAALRR
jgi:hypothetical protein